MSLIGTAISLFCMITIVLFLPGIVLMIIVNIPLAWWVGRYNKKKAEADWGNVQKPWYDIEEDDTSGTTPW